MKRRSFSPLALVVMIAPIALATQPAFADDASTNRTRAQQLFESALGDVQSGNFAGACPKFAASCEADPKTSTLLNLGSCYESLGRSASAWAAFREAEGLARKTGRTDLEGRARASAEALAPKLVRLTVVVPQENRAPALVVSRDGSKLAAAEWGVGIPIDEGEHEISAEAPGRLPWRTKIDVRGGNRSLEVPNLAVVPKAAKAPPDQAPAAAPPSWWTPLRTTGVALAGVGLASAATGAVLAFVAKSDYDDARTQCRAVDDCPGDAVRSADGARSLATGGTVALVAGATIAAIGGALILLSPRARTEDRARTGFASVAVSPIGIVGQW